MCLWSIVVSYNCHSHSSTIVMSPLHYISHDPFWLRHYSIIYTFCFTNSYLWKINLRIELTHPSSLLSVTFKDKTKIHMIVTPEISASGDSPQLVSFNTLHSDFTFVCFLLFCDNINTNKQEKNITKTKWFQYIWFII